MSVDGIRDSMMARLSAANDSSPPSIPPLRPAKSHRLTKMFRGTRSTSSSNLTPASTSSTNLTAGVNPKPQTPVLKPGFEKDAENTLEASPGDSETMSVVAQGPIGGGVTTHVKRKSKGTQVQVRPGTSPARHASVLPVPVNGARKVEVPRSTTDKTPVFRFDNPETLSFPASGPAQDREDDRNGVGAKRDEKKEVAWPSFSIDKPGDREEQLRASNAWYRENHAKAKNEASPSFSFRGLANREQQDKPMKNPAPSFSLSNFRAPLDHEQQDAIYNNLAGTPLDVGIFETFGQQDKTKNDSAPSSNFNQPAFAFNTSKNCEKQDKAKRNSAIFSNANQPTSNFDQPAFGFGTLENREKQDKTKNDSNLPLFSSAPKDILPNTVPKSPSTIISTNVKIIHSQDRHGARKLSTPSRADTPRPTHIPSPSSESRSAVDHEDVRVYIERKVVQVVEMYVAKLKADSEREKEIETSVKNGNGGSKDNKGSVVGKDNPSQHGSSVSVNARPCPSHPSIVTIGPYKITNPTAVMYLQISAMAFYAVFLVLPAFAGPKELFLTIWRIAIVLGLHVAVLGFMGWVDAEHGIAANFFVEPVVYGVAMLAHLVRERREGVVFF